MNKIITFLGTGDYQPTTYYHVDGRQSASVCYFALALAELYPDYQVLVLATAEANRAHGSTLLGQLRGRPAGFWIEPIGEIVSEDELWNTFEIIQQQVQDGDRLVVDITHSFRSLPFLAFLVLAYLRVVRDFDLEAVLYAPYQRYDLTTVYDLSRFVDLLDWTTATHLFLETGHAALLVQRLTESEWSKTADANALEETSAALRLARPDEARRLAYDWAQTLAVLDPSDLDTRARPFGLLLKRVQAEMQRIAPQPQDPADLAQELTQELELIRWNFDRGQLMSTVTVAREWLVSLMCWCAGCTGLVEEQDYAGNGKRVGEWQSKRGREKAEQALKALSKLASLTPEERRKQLGSQTPSARDLFQNRQELAETLGRTWTTVNALRNDLNHAGKVHTTDPRPLNMLLQEAKQVPDLLQALFGQSGLNVPGE